MPGFKVLMLLLYAGFGALMAGFALPLIRRKIAPNLVYGFRTPRTLADPAAWYEANAYAGRCLLAAGLATAGATVGLFFVPGVDPIAYAVSCLAVSLVGIVASLALSFRYLGRIGRR